MKKTNLKFTAFALIMIFLNSCGDPELQDDHQDHHKHHDHSETGEHHESNVVVLSKIQLENLDLKLGEIAERNIGEYVLTTGQLEVPPQNEASVTAILGSNVSSIKVIEGDKISKGQIIAYLSHPNIIHLQSSYIKAWSEFNQLDKELIRQTKLHSKKVNSGKELEIASAEQMSAKAQMNGLKAQLQMLGVGIVELEKGHIQKQIPVKSPIDGYIRSVAIKTGQFVNPQTEMFEIVNIDHIHADFMVFEKDIHKVKKGQKVIFSVESLPETELNATIYSVGKAFEQNPKAVHLHAEIENKQGVLIPGMYAQGKICLNERMEFALPEEAVAEYNNEYFVFLAIQKKEGMEFKPLKIKISSLDDSWIGLVDLDSKYRNEKFALTKAYDILAEWKKEEAEHSH